MNYQNEIHLKRQVSALQQYQSEKDVKLLYGRNGHRATFPAFQKQAVYMILRQDPLNVRMNLRKMRSKEV